MSALKRTIFLCLLTCFLKCSVSEEIKAKSGEDVLLQCHNPRDADIRLVKWIRPDLKSEGFVFFFRDKRIYKNYQHPSFLSRVVMVDPEMSSQSVILKKVNTKDTGTYQCYVGNESGSELINTITLIVTNAEKNVKTGDDVTLQCQGPRDADIYTVMLKWIRPDLKSDGYLFYFSDNQEQKQHQHFHGRVELRDPQMKDGDFSVILKNVNIKDTGTYECRVGYKGNKPQLINTINLIVKYSGDAAGRSGDEGDRDGGDRDGHVGLILGLSVVVLVVVVSFIIYRKCRRPREQNNQPPANEAAVHELQVLNVTETEGGRTGGGGTPSSDMS